MKQTIEIEVPEGYEVAEGVQPRTPKKNEYFISRYSDEALQANCDHSDGARLIILKKKAPRYKKQTSRAVVYVEIKALEDALELLRVRDSDWSLAHEIKADALKELVK